MASLLSPLAILSTPSPSSYSSKPLLLKQPQQQQQQQQLLQLLPPLTLKPLSLAAAAAAAVILLSPLPATASSSLHLYYGTAASAANYGGYGGNASKKDTAEYTYLVPDSWKERLVSKVEKGTNGTDSEFYNPKKKSEKEYLTFLSGFRALAPMDAVLNNLALSDVDLQDLIASAQDGVKSNQAADDKGQLYYEYEIDGAGAHSLIKVTCARNKLYAHFVNAPNAEWSRDEEMLRELHDSFKTVDNTTTAAASS